MIKLYKVAKEQRKRDKKRYRIILEIGKKKYHLTRSELEKLISKGLTLMLWYPDLF